MLSFCTGKHLYISCSSQSSSLRLKSYVDIPEGTTGIVGKRGATVPYIEDETKAIVSLSREQENRVFIYGETGETIMQAELEIAKNIVSIACMRAC